MKHLGVLIAASAAMISSSASAQRPLTLVEGAACAMLSHQIETLGAANEGLLEEIAQSQVAAGARGSAREAEGLAFHHGRMVGLRRGWIEDYERICSRGEMSVTDLRRVCRTDSVAFDFSVTAFCKPLIEAGL